MFTLEQIKKAHSNIKSGLDFSSYIQEIKALGVEKYLRYVADGHTDYFGENDFKLSSPEKYEDLVVANQIHIDQFKIDLKEHQIGKTDYPTFFSQCAKNGVEKWEVDTHKMTCTYFDKAGNEVLTEFIPEVSR
jgi:uncharacterized protein YbcV (DUF1398 family)